MGGTPPRPCVVRVQQAQQAPRPPSQVILALEEADSFLWELMPPSAPQASFRQGDMEGCHSEWWGLCWRQGYPQSRGTMWCLREDWDSCHLGCGGLPCELAEVADVGAVPQSGQSRRKCVLARPGRRPVANLPGTAMSNQQDGFLQPLAMSSDLVGRQRAAGRHWSVPQGGVANGSRSET